LSENKHIPFAGIGTLRAKRQRSRAQHAEFTSRNVHLASVAAAAWPLL
jgi:hypothetical protein